MKKKILMLNMEFPPIGGGAAHANYCLLHGMRNNQQFEIDLVTSSPINMYEEENLSKTVRVIKLNINKKTAYFWTSSEIIVWTWKAYCLTKRLLTEQNYNLIHCWFGWPSGIIGYLFRKKVPYIIALRGSDVPGYNIRLRNLDKCLFNIISRIIWHNASAITTNSTFLRDLSRRTYHNKTIDVIYNGVDCDRFRPVINKHQKVTILFVGRLVARKGVDYLLKAFKELHLRGFDCSLNIAGTGPEEESLMNFCKTTGIDRQVTFLGQGAPENIAAIYQQADIFVLPSLAESMPNVILEAMASGLPIISTNTGAAELIDGNGFIVQTRNYRMIRDAIIHYINSPALLKTHGIMSRRIAEQMGWQNTINAYLRIYSSIIE